MDIIANVAGAELDAIVLGRAGMDLYPDPPGTRTHNAQRFTSDLGGSAGNIAVAMARYGARIGLAAPVSDDPVGEFVTTKLAEFGVRHLTPEPVPGTSRTSLALAESVAEGSRTVIYRNDAADFRLEPLPHDLVQSAKLVVISGTALAADPSRSSCFDAIRSSHTAVLDLDYRPYSWADQDTLRDVYAEAFAACDLLVGNDEEFAMTAPDGLSGEDHATALSNTATVIYKMGSKGSRLVKDGNWSDLVPPFLVEALKPFGAGDAFLGGLLAELLSGREITLAMRFGAAAAALVVSRVGCASAMPSRDEVEAFIASREGQDA